MSGRLRAAWLAVAGVLLAAGGAWGQRIESAPVPGPVGLSVGNESRIALIRAERWLERHKGKGEELPCPAGMDEVEDGEGERLMPLLGGDSGCLRQGENVCEAWRRLAAGLAREGGDMVYLDGMLVPWRNAILHELVVSQKLDDMGGGWWGNGEEDALRATRAAYATLRFLLGGGATGN